MKVKRIITIKIEDDVDIIDLGCLKPKDEFAKQIANTIRHQLMFDKAEVISCSYKTIENKS